MTQANPDIQYLLDRAAIHDLHVRYYHGIDIGNVDQVRSCFTTGIVAHYHGRASVRGIDDLIKSIPSFGKQASGEWKISTHFMGNLNYKSIEGDVAETEVNAFAFLVLTDGPADRVAMRSLRYLDRLVRVEGKWRISERMHTLDWACDVPTTFATKLAEHPCVLEARLFGVSKMRVLRTMLGHLRLLAAVLFFRVR